MSTGKRLAKRSIIGTRVCAPGEDGKYYSGVIQAVKTPANFDNNNCINLTPNTRYTVRFDSRQGNLGRTTAEFLEMDLIGPGFRSVLGLELVPDQKCFVTYNGREVTGDVTNHNLETDEVLIRIHPPGTDAPFEVQKRLDEVRLLESRKSARLADQDTDFARLADMAGDRKRTASHTIDVPASSVHNGSRKRRPSASQDDPMKDDLQMDECSAALVLMSLSCSPHSPNFNALQFRLGTSPPESTISSSSADSYRSTPSPPPVQSRSYSPQNVILTNLSSSPGTDEGIDMEEYLDEIPKKKKIRRRLPEDDLTFMKSEKNNSYLSRTPKLYLPPQVDYQVVDDEVSIDGDNGDQEVTIFYRCSWRQCRVEAVTVEDIEAHVRKEHLQFPYRDPDSIQPGEEEFYYNEVVVKMIDSPGPTQSHMDMARPFHEDPDYQRQLVGTFRQNLFAGINNGPLPQSPHKLLKLSPQRPHSPKMPVSPRRVRGENKKCRKVYGMDHRDQWCTQCKWKKACSRFGD